MVRLGDGTAEANERTQKALNTLWKFTGEFFIPSDADNYMLEKEFGVDLVKLKSVWNQKVSEILFIAKLSIPESEYQVTGGKEGKHSENLGHILTEMQFLPTKYPDARW